MPRREPPAPEGRAASCPRSPAQPMLLHRGRPINYFKLSSCTPKGLHRSWECGLNAHVEYVNGNKGYPVIVGNSDWNGNGGGEIYSRLDSPEARRWRWGGVHLYELPPGVEYTDVKGRRTGAINMSGERHSTKRFIEMVLELFGEDAWEGATPTSHDKFCAFFATAPVTGSLDDRRINETHKNYEDDGFIWHPFKKQLTAYSVFDEACKAFPLGGKWDDFSPELKAKFADLGPEAFEVAEEEAWREAPFDEYEEEEPKKPAKPANKTGLVLHLRDVLSRAERRAKKELSASLNHKERADLTKRLKSRRFCSWVAERTERLLETL